MKNGHVRDWMISNPIAVDSQVTLPEAYELMKAHSIRRLPVVDHGKLIGIVTISDIRQAAPLGSMEITQNNSLFSHTRVGRIMSQPAVTIQPDETLRDAAKKMMEYKFGGLPVVEDGQLIGIITESDIFRMLISTLEDAPLAETAKA